jgi:serine/threonine protein kinase
MKDSRTRHSRSRDDGDEAQARETGMDDADPARFEQLSLIDEGGMGTIHLAFDHLMLRDVALKTLRDELWGDEGRTQDFIQEAQITGQLGHPNIVPVYGLRTDASGVPSFVMKYVEGETFATTIKRLHAEPGEAALQKALEVLLKVCDAISFAHERGVIHCDLKPDNVMVGTHGQVYVMDWGVARLLDGARVKCGGVDGNRATSRSPGGREVPSGGTIGYMAPEQLKGDQSAIDVTTDIYCLGGILCVLLTGNPPRHEVPRDISDWYTTPDLEQRKALPEVPPELCRIAERALSPAPADRHQSVAELKADLEAFLAGGGWFATHQYLAGDVIIREGEAGSEAFIIASGLCDVFRETPDGARFVRSMGPGDTFGELSVLTRMPRSATVVAQTDVVLRRVTRDALDHELKHNPVLASFMSAIASRFAELEAKLGVEGD